MKLSFVNGNFDDIINVLSINFPVKESIEVGKAHFIALSLIESVTISHSVLDRKELLTDFASIDFDVPPLSPSFLVANIGEKVDFNRSTMLVFLKPLICLEINVQFL